MDDVGRYDNLHGDEDEINYDYQQRLEEKLDAQANEQEWGYDD